MDPGLRHSGWGVIDMIHNTLLPVAHGVVHSVTEEGFAERLFQLFKGLSQVIEDFEPHEAAVEETFINKNPASALKLGMARGVVLLVPAYFHLPVAEYSANRVKKTVVGVGHADKDQVAAMVQRLLPQVGKVKLDAADALAVAICHAHYRQSNALLERVKNDQ